MDQTTSYDAEYVRPSGYLQMYQQAHGIKSTHAKPAKKRMLNTQHLSNLNVIRKQADSDEEPKRNRRLNEWMDRESSSLTPRGGSCRSLENGSKDQILSRVAAQLRVAPKQIRQNLRKADQDYDGKVTVKDLLMELKHQGLQIRDEEMHSLVSQEQDRENPGYVDYEKFSERLSFARTQRSVPATASHPLVREKRPNLRIQVPESGDKKLYVTRSTGSSPTTPPWSPRFQSSASPSPRCKQLSNIVL